MRHPFFFSTLFHLLFFGIIFLGLPFSSKPKPYEVPALMVDLIVLDKKTERAGKLPQEKPKKIKKKPKKLAPKKINQSTAKKKAIAKLESPKAITKSVKKPPLKIKEKLPPASKPQPLPAIEKPKPKAKAKPLKIKDPLEALFKDLDQMKLLLEEKKKQEELKKTESHFNGGDKLTLSEKDALIYQIQSNWHYIPGSYDKVPPFRVMIGLNEKGEPQTVTLLDHFILKMPKGRACFESIKRAILRSTPLKLPMDKRENWQDGVRVTIDPTRRE